MKIEYDLITKSHLTDEVRECFAAALKQQGKVQGNLLRKADRVKLLCIAKTDGKIAGIGAIKVKTESDFSIEKAGLSKQSSDFEWELGYMYTNPSYAGKGIAKNIARMLLDEFGQENLMASTEISANPAMVKILEQLGFRLYGNPWNSNIHNNYLGLFLRYI